MRLKALILIVLASLYATLFLPNSASAASCSATFTTIDFGTISVRSGTTNQTSGSMTIECSGLPVLDNPLIGVCVEFGAGSGGSANSTNSPRYLRNAQNVPLAYELRPNGNGAGNGTLNRMFVLMPISLLGRASMTIPIYADVTATGEGLSTGPYQSTFGTDVTLRYGLISCDLLGTPGTVTGFVVRGNVSSSCEVDSTALNFGSLAPVITTPVDQLASITVRCTDATPFDLRLGLGAGPAVNDPERRRMTNGLGWIDYGLYQNSARTVPWGDTPSTDVSGVGQGAAQTFGVFGRVHSGQTALPGIYSDQVVITIEY